MVWPTSGLYYERDKIKLAYFINEASQFDIILKSIFGESLHILANQIIS